VIVSSVVSLFGIVSVLSVKLIKQKESSTREERRNRVMAEEPHYFLRVRVVARRTVRGRGNQGKKLETGNSAMD
jgi:hypothetical protein